MRNRSTMSKYFSSLTDRQVHSHWLLLQEFDAWPVLRAPLFHAPENDPDRVLLPL